MWKVGILICTCPDEHACTSMHYFEGHMQCLCIHYYIIATHAECCMFPSIAHSLPNMSDIGPWLVCHNTIISKGPCRWLWTCHFHCYVPCMSKHTSIQLWMCYCAALPISCRAVAQCLISMHMSLMNPLTQCLWTVPKIRTSRSTADKWRI